MSHSIVETFERSGVCKQDICQRFPLSIELINSYEEHLRDIGEFTHESIPPDGERLREDSFARRVISLALDLIVYCKTHHTLEEFQQSTPHQSISRRLKFVANCARNYFNYFKELQDQEEYEGKFCLSVCLSVYDSYSLDKHSHHSLLKFFFSI